VHITAFTEPEHLSPPYPTHFQLLLFSQNEVPSFFVIDEGMKYTLTIAITPATILCPEIGLLIIHSLSFDVM